jgi:hypothetical protein
MCHIGTYVYTLLDKMGVRNLLLMQQDTEVQYYEQTFFLVKL